MLVLAQQATMFGGYNRQRAPILATHKVFKTGRYIRITANEYVDEYILDKWEESCHITVEQVLETHRKDFIKLYKVGIDKKICNLYQWCVKSKYRVP